MSDFEQEQTEATETGWIKCCAPNVSTGRFSVSSVCSCSFWVAYPVSINKRKFVQVHN